MASEDPHLTAYLAVHARVSELASASRAALDQVVPSCPDWTARQVIAHMAGLIEDWGAGRFDGYGSPSWTEDQVARFETQPISDVLASWKTAVEAFCRISESQIGGTPGMWAFGDGVVHEADLRPVLAPGTRVPADAMALGLKAAIARWRQALAGAGVPPLKITATDMRHWWVGDDHDLHATTVTTTGHELFRALYGRRSRDQVEAWDWSADPADYLDVGLPFPFEWASRAISD